MSSALLMEETLAFKADFVPMTVIKLSNADLASIKKQISATVVSAPNYFKNAPIVIDVTALDGDKSQVDFNAICTLLRDQEMLPLGIRGLEKHEHNLALSKGLAVIKAAKPPIKKEPSLTSGSKPKEKPEAPKASSLKTKLVTTPIRSGTQVYAKGGDLVVLSAVNSGAECFADGNIHVYGPLRGKALAGANGNKNARIFCESLEAELISIAGHYLSSNQIKAPKTKKPMVQIYLKDDKLHIDSI